MAIQQRYGKKAHKDYVENSEFHLKEAMKELFPEQAYKHLWEDKQD